MAMKEYKKEEEFAQKIVDIARVTRVMKGGKRMKFRVCLVIGDKKGRVGYAVAKGADVAVGVNKALQKAKKNLVRVNIADTTIPHFSEVKYKAARVMVKPAPKGTGIKAGGAVRIILELAGYENVVGKILGKTKNKVNIVKATFKALEGFRKVEKKEKSDNKKETVKPKEETVSKKTEKATKEQKEQKK